MQTPLYDALKAYAAANPLRFHMPGHKGAGMPAPELAPLCPIDVTELPPTGNLYAGGAPFAKAQQLWADIFGFDNCQFLTGGASMGIHTGLSLFCAPQEEILLERGCHRAVYHALALLDLMPHFIYRPWLQEENMVGALTPDMVRQQLEKHPNVKTVCITSPTYYGLLSDIAGISRVVHAHGAKLFVDGAHGAHLPFLGIDAFFGADGVVLSAHKTLPAMGQSALLLTNGVTSTRVAQMAAVFGSSSPSYPMMASLDVARAWLLENAGEYQRAAQRVQALRARFPSLGGELPLDPTRFTLCVKNGLDFTNKLQQRGVFAEMEDGGHVVFICTAADGEDDFDRLEHALLELRAEMGACTPLPPPPVPQRAVSAREALFAPSEFITLAQSAGRICTGQLAPYPPGVPIVAQSERITKKELSYLQEIGYDISQEVSVMLA